MPVDLLMWAAAEAAQADAQRAQQQCAEVHAGAVQSEEVMKAATSATLHAQYHLLISLLLYPSSGVMLCLLLLPCSAASQLFLPCSYKNNGQSSMICPYCNAG